MSSKILLLEDDLLFGETLLDLLVDEGYEVSHFLNGKDALDATFAAKYDLYLLDINVPLIDGISLLGELRSADDMTPTIFLTSHTDKEMLKKGFMNGGDDYIIKPFDNEELLLRLQALLKRSVSQQHTRIGPFVHDAFHKTITYEGKKLEFSKKEYELFVILLNNVNNTVPKELILQELWSANEGGSEGAIRVYINRIKQLLPQVKIENIRGIGYKLVF